MKTTGKIIMGRPSLGSGEDVMRIELRDDNSKQIFATLTMTLPDFMKALTGQAHMPFSAVYKNLDVVGLERVREQRIVQEPEGVKHKLDLEQWLLDNCQEDGWIIDPYLGSQGSRTHKDGKVFLNYAVYKFIEPTDVKDS